jgi:hypothetical protein
MKQALEMPDRGLASESGAKADAALLIEHGIVWVPPDRYEVDGYRYSTLADALAQAKRTLAYRAAGAGRR